MAFEPPAVKKELYCSSSDVVAISGSVSGRRERLWSEREESRRRGMLVARVWVVRKRRRRV